MIRTRLIVGSATIVLGTCGMLKIGSTASAAPIRDQVGFSHFLPQDELVDFGDGSQGLPRVHTDVPDLPRPELPPMQMEFPVDLPKLMTPLAQPDWLEYPEHDLSNLMRDAGGPPILHTDLPDLPDLIHASDDWQLPVVRGERAVLSPPPGGSYTLRSIPSPGSIGLLLVTCVAVPGTRRRRR